MILIQCMSYKLPGLKGLTEYNYTPLHKESRCSNDTCRNRTAMKKLLLDHYDAGVYICQAYNHHQSYTEKEKFLTVECNPAATYTCKEQIKHTVLCCIKCSTDGGWIYN